MLQALAELNAVLTGRPLVEESAPAERPAYEAPAIEAVSRNLQNLKGRVFPTSVPGVQLTLVQPKAAMRLPRATAFTLAVPLVVQYDGKAEGAIWAEAERVMEKAVADILVGAVGEYVPSPKAKLMKRRKSRPFEEGSPLSLTILRYRVEKP